ncbi:Ig-like domain-containing protein [Solirubrobacter phytolaccae]|uniref:Ig-like domain-containing protein n=1 Tax=Solirubrobacter phytolaccae TaxID=1404360 RepID=A0A9X3SC65_9ACTN|nr:Ig-like domain-containing protein [Solirubrobacter phytolaccae]MDA0178772.1 Ig-like domain-containing protein [Solirubrobacter phytolaccae]
MRTLAAAVLALLVTASPAWAAPATITFDKNTTFDVPAGVTSFSLVAVGGSGTSRGNAIGGRGARVTGTMTVVPGARLRVAVGGGGGAGSAGSPGGTGGGMAALLEGATYRFVAAGGGGAGASALSIVGGDGGNALAAGKDSTGLVTHAKGGGAGTQSAGGAPGTGGGGSATTGQPGAAGVSGAGGAGGNGHSTVGSGGGGGGGGFFGGGGGGGAGSAVESAAGGGGGSNYFDPAVVSGTSQAILTSESTPQLSITFEDPAAPALAFNATGTTLSGTAGTSLGDNPTVSLELTDAGGRTYPLALTPGTGGAFSVPTRGLAEGDWTAVARQTDGSGQTATVTRTFTVDRTAPALTLLAEGARLSGTTTDTTPVTITVRNASGAPLAIVATPANGAFATDLTLPDGSYTASAVQDDAAGNHGTTGTVTFVLDTVAPNLSIDGTTDDPSDVTLELSNGTTRVVKVTSGRFEPIPTDLADGTYTVKARQTDAAGNTATTAERAFTVETPKGSPQVITVPSPPERIIVPAAAGKQAAGLAVTSAQRKRGKLTLAGTAAGTGKVTVKVGKAKVTATIVRGKWKATLKAKAIKVTVTYAGDATHLGGSTSLTVR